MLDKYFELGHFLDSHLLTKTSQFFNYLRKKYTQKYTDYCWFNVGKFHYLINRFNACTNKPGVYRTSYAVSFATADENGNEYPGSWALVSNTPASPRKDEEPKLWGSSILDQNDAKEMCLEAASRLYDALKSDYEDMLNSK
jgi:hypothetical protein